MKTLLSIICIATLQVLVLAEPDIFARIVQADKECQSDPETKAPEEYVHKYDNGEEFDLHHVKDYFFCLYKKLDIMDEEGKIDDVVLKRVLEMAVPDKQKWEPAFDCAEDKDTADETAVALTYCIRPLKIM